MAKPLLYPEWAATDTTLPATGNTNKQRPKESLRNIGWDKGQIPTAEEWNWQFDNISDWIKWFDENNESLKTITLTGDTTGTVSYTNEAGISLVTTTIQSAHADEADHALQSDNADKWTTTRTFSFTGFATGSGLVDGSGNVTFSLSSGTGFANVKAVNGYTYLPNGYIKQFGTTGTLLTTGTTVTLPITFPTACTGIQVTIIADTTDDYELMVSSVGTSSFVCKSHLVSCPAMYWEAIGY